jgi:hypothetical protein
VRAPRERRAAPRASSEPAIELAAPTSHAIALPTPALDSGLSDDEIASAGGARRSLLGRVGGWFGNVWRRDA